MYPSKFLHRCVVCDACVEFRAYGELKIMNKNCVANTITPIIVIMLRSSNSIIPKRRYA